METKFYLLRIKLLEIEPEIWRRFIVPADILLADLHEVIQIVMGWLDSHLHEFKIGKDIYTKYLFDGYEDDLDANDYSLEQLAKRRSKTFRYLYDLGDYWQHEIVLEDSNFKHDDKRRAFCLDGENAAPPEDCGSVSGFEEFREIITNPKHEEYKDYLRWYRSFGYPDKKYDPKNFDIARVNKKLAKLKLHRPFY